MFVDAFAGCGGLSLGLTRAGWQALFAIEQDEFAFATLSTNFPEGDGPFSFDWPNDIERRPWDIHRLLSERKDALDRLVNQVDLLAGGPPCQGVSHAGRRRPDDPRNKLFDAYLDLVAILRPRLVLLENVQGFRTNFKTSPPGPKKNYAATLVRSLSQHYDVAAALIHTEDYGVPQKRRRYFVLAALKTLSLRAPISTFFEDMKCQVLPFLSERDLPTRPTARDAISDLEIPRNGTVPSPDTHGYRAIAYNAPRTAYQRAMRDGHEGTAPDTRLARHRQDIRERFSAIIAACREAGRLNVTISPEIRAIHGLQKTAIRVLDPLQPAPTITTLPDDLLHYSEPRTLTVRENARLQSFPDWFAFKGNYTTGGQRRQRETPRFSQVANAVPPLLAEQLGLALLPIARQSLSPELPIESLTDDA